jgi:TolB-like protein/DNA-binding winged helix-turn-helix (wHTH) protein/Flp pilus assembly protein TadD
MIGDAADCGHARRVALVAPRFRGGMRRVEPTAIFWQSAGAEWALVERCLVHDGPMTIRDPDSPAQGRSTRLQFDGYVLDAERGSLLRGGDELALRPKTFAVLQFLLENAGRLVSKDEIMAAVWLNVAITDDVLVQSVGEIRRALGDDGPRLIRTVPRRGYRFEGAVSVVDPVPPSRDERDPPAAQIPEPSHSGPRPVSIRLALAVALIVLLAAAALWQGIRTDWAFRNPAGVPERAGDGSAPVGAALAILPMVHQGDDPARAYFADGLTQDIINALGRFSALTVMSWNAVLPYKGQPAPPQELGRRLGVAYLVEGSVRRTDDRVRVSAQLVDTAGGRVLWSARYDEPLADLFALQDRITAQIVAALAVRVTQLEERRVLAKPTDNLEAYDYVLRARPALQRPTRAGLVEARAFLRRALELDPNYAAAHAALAETFYTAASLGFAESPATFLGRAEELAGKALSLDANEVRARIILGRIQLVRQRHKQAEAEIERAIAINPNDAGAIAGRGNVLMWLGQTDAAVAALEQAQRIDPDLNTMDRFALGLAYYLSRRYERAAEQAELNLRDETGAGLSRVVLAAAYGQLARADDAERVAATIRRTDPTFDPQEFGSKFLSPDDLAHLRDGLRKAGLLTASQ